MPSKEPLVAEGYSDARYIIEAEMNAALTAFDLVPDSAGRPREIDVRRDATWHLEDVRDSLKKALDAAEDALDYLSGALE